MMWSAARHIAILLRSPNGYCLDSSRDRCANWRAGSTPISATISRVNWLISLVNLSSSVITPPPLPVPGLTPWATLFRRSAASRLPTAFCLLPTADCLLLQSVPDGESLGHPDGALGEGATHDLHLLLGRLLLARQDLVLIGEGCVQLVDGGFLFGDDGLVRCRLLLAVGGLLVANHGLLLTGIEFDERGVNLSQGLVAQLVGGVGFALRDDGVGAAGRGARCGAGLGDCGARLYRLGSRSSHTRPRICGPKIVRTKAERARHTMGHLRGG